ncbi:MAG: hypothetical protein WCQ96_02360 [Patescibacteria group bacterium]
MKDRVKKYAQGEKTGHVKTEIKNPVRCILNYGFLISDHTRNGVNNAG